MDSTSSGSGGRVSLSLYSRFSALHLSAPIWWKGRTSTRLTTGRQRSTMRATFSTLAGSSVRPGTRTNRTHVSMPRAASRSPKAMVGARERPVTLL